jgi:hypothetical protein
MPTAMLRTTEADAEPRDKKRDRKSTTPARRVRKSDSNTDTDDADDEAGSRGRRRRKRTRDRPGATVPVVIAADVYMTTDEAAAYLKLAPQTLEAARYKADGSGPPYVKLPRAVRYRRSQLDAWMAKHDHPADRPTKYKKAPSERQASMEKTRVSRPAAQAPRHAAAPAAPARGPA